MREKLAELKTAAAMKVKNDEPRWTREELEITMGKRSAVGVTNGNWKGAEMREYMREVTGETKSSKPVLCGCGKVIENPWYGSRNCFSCERELREEYKRIYPIFEDAVATLMDAVIIVYGDYAPLDWPWTDDDMRDEIMNRYPV